MNRPRRRWPILLIALACAGDRVPGNDTVASEGSPPAGPLRRPPTSTWDPRAGTLFAIRSGSNGLAWIINPAYGQGQVLDSLTPASWEVEGTALALLDGAQVPGTGTISGVRFDSTCAGWPAASIVPGTGDGASWRVAFPDGRVDGTAFDSLPDLVASDSAKRTRTGALAASRLPDDTVASFRGRPFIVRQASRFQVAPDTTATLFEVTRMVAQEANPLQEQLLIIAEEGPSDAVPRTTFHDRKVGLEEALPSIELLAVLRVRATGRLALLVRREHENGFVLEWIERSARGRWVVRWRSALDAC